MILRDIELYHGAVLARLVRSDRPVTLQMETDGDNGCSVYMIRDAVAVAAVYAKYCGHGHYYPAKRSVTWKFTFQPSHLDALQRLSKKYKEPNVYVALVCANHALPGCVADQNLWLVREIELRRGFTGVCFLHPGEWRRCLESSTGKTRSLVVEFARDKSFVVNGDLIVPQNALQDWQSGRPNHSRLRRTPKGKEADYQRLLATIPVD